MSTSNIEEDTPLPSETKSQEADEQGEKTAKSKGAPRIAVVKEKSIQETPICVVDTSLYAVSENAEEYVEVLEEMSPLLKSYVNKGRPTRASEVVPLSRYPLHCMVPADSTDIIEEHWKGFMHIIPAENSFGIHPISLSSRPSNTGKLLVSIPLMFLRPTALFGLKEKSTTNQSSSSSSSSNGLDSTNQSWLASWISCNSRGAKVLQKYMKRESVWRWQGGGKNKLIDPIDTVSFVIDTEKYAKFVISIFEHNLRRKSENKDSAIQKQLGFALGMIKRACHLFVYRLQKCTFSEARKSILIVYADGSPIVASSPLVVPLFCVAFGAKCLDRPESRPMIVKAMAQVAEKIFSMKFETQLKYLKVCDLDAHKPTTDFQKLCKGNAINRYWRPSKRGIMALTANRQDALQFVSSGRKVPGDFVWPDVACPAHADHTRKEDKKSPPSPKMKTKKRRTNEVHTPLQEYSHPEEPLVSPETSSSSATEGSMVDDDEDDDCSKPPQTCGVLGDLASSLPTFHETSETNEKTKKLRTPQSQTSAETSQTERKFVSYDDLKRIFEEYLLPSRGRIAKSLKKMEALVGEIDEKQDKVAASVGLILDTMASHSQVEASVQELASRTTTELRKWREESMKDAATLLELTHNPIESSRTDTETRRKISRRRGGTSSSITTSARPRRSSKRPNTSSAEDEEHRVDKKKKDSDSEDEDEDESTSDFNADDIASDDDDTSDIHTSEEEEYASDDDDVSEEEISDSSSDSENEDVEIKGDEYMSILKEEIGSVKHGKPPKDALVITNDDILSSETFDDDDDDYVDLSEHSSSSSSKANAVVVIGTNQTLDGRSIRKVTHCALGNEYCLGLEMEVYGKDDIPKLLITGALGYKLPSRFSHFPKSPDRIPTTINLRRILSSGKLTRARIDEEIQNAILGRVPIGKLASENPIFEVGLCNTCRKMCGKTESEIKRKLNQIHKEDTSWSTTDIHRFLIKANILLHTLPLPLRTETFVEGSEWCLHCNQGYFTKTRTDEESYVRLTPDTTKMSPSICRIMRSHIPKVDVYYRIPSREEESAFCTDQCRIMFDHATEKLAERFRKKSELLQKK